MRLADDRRGRIPFALVGVILLVGSATIVATTPTAPTSTSAVDHAVQSATASTQTALRDAVQRAGRAAARDPVTHRANTSWGRTLRRNHTFEDALRARIYLEARRSLAQVTERSGDVTATASLPAIDTPADLRRAIARVTVERAGPNGTALRVTIANVTVTARRGGHVVGARDVSPTQTVDAPVLALHERVRAFEAQLDAGVLHPGLGQRVTAQLYALAWARAYAQYGGANVSNVVSNRHVELTTNGAALEVQRATLGASDPGGERAHSFAALRVATTDVALAGPLDPYDVDRIHRIGEHVTGRSATTGQPLDRPAGAHPDATVTVGVDRSADAALADLSAGGLDGAIRRAYGVDVRPFARVRHVDTTDRDDPPPPGAWVRNATASRVSRTVATRPVGFTAAVPGDWRVFERHERVVTVRRVERTVWRHGNRTTVTRDVRVERYAVAVAVAGKHSAAAGVPRNGVSPVYEAGGALGGPNLAGVPRKARNAVADGDVLARRAVSGTLGTQPPTVAGDRPAGLRSWIRDDVAELHARVRDISTTVPRGEVGTYASSPAARLADRLRSRRAVLVDAPATYDGVADKARVEARHAYVDAVIAELDRRADAHRDEESSLEDALGNRGIGSLSRLRDVMAVGENPRRSPTPTDGPMHVTVDTAPSYLTLDSVSYDRIDARGTGSTTPLAARNVNLFSVPYGDASDTVAGELFGSDRVRLRTAAGTLRAAEAYPPTNASFRRDRGRLRDAVAAANDHVRTRLRWRLRQEGVGRSRADRVALVQEGLAPWPTVGARGEALANGSASKRIAAAATDRAGDRAWLAAALNDTVDDAVTDAGAQVDRSVVNRTADGARAHSRRAMRDVASSVGSTLARNATELAAVRLSKGKLSAIPAGLPVAPWPGYWYVTTNVWVVESRGTYARVSVRSRRGLRDTVYTRDGSTVAVDVDGDGAPERLGRSPRVGFEVRTYVVVVVPAGMPGMGDTDGNADERSQGWPHPG